MGIHAFHVPLAALLALWWSPTTGLTSLDEKRGLMSVGWDPMIPRRVSTVMTVFVLLGVIFANAIVWEISKHEELRPVTQGDLEIREKLSSLPEGSIVYSENAHWGHIFDSPSNIELTSIPTLGLVQLDSSIHSKATTAIMIDNTTAIKELGVNYAITSPIGTMGWTFAMSPYWLEIENIRGSKIWQFTSLKDADVSKFSVVDEQSCNDGCEMRIEPWNNHRFRTLDNLSENRAFIQQGTESEISFIHNGDSIQNATTCLVYEAIGEIDDLTISYSGVQAIEVQTSSGWNQQCWTMDYTLENMNFSFDWDEDSKPNSWINPTGLSGRGDRIFDTSGIRLHWLEIR
tara:strand:- start:36 stop:1070 length:1035 start_codon:yes stop_codon:yes gene_type:complete